MTDAAASPSPVASALPVVPVVAAALVDATGAVLIAERPAGKPLAGRWEFPGGKIAAGESDVEALARELREELGIDLARDAQAPQHLLTLRHDYPDRCIELRCYAVPGFTGAARPLDGQRLKWVAPAALDAEDILEADRPFIDALQRVRYQVVNPRTGAVDHRFDAPSAAELAATLARLRAAQPAWAAAPLAHRIEVLGRWRAEWIRRQQDIIDALTLDTGRHLISRVEVTGLPGTIDRWCKLAPALAQEEEFRSAALPHISYRSQYVPYALVGAISPWNFPVSLCFIDAIPALLAGCAVFVKPSEVTPRFAIPAMQSIAAVPELAAVLQVQPGGRETGERLVQSVDAVCFTGSVATGRKVAEAAARQFVPAFLELGGKDPLIVTASADLERATDVALRATCLATGQACQSLERIYVDRRIFAPFVERLVEKARRVEPNWPDIHAGTIGPFIFGKQADIVAAQLADARAKGARVLCGGEILDHGGKWLLPTVLVDVDHSMTVMTEETFGPVIPVMAYDTVDEAVALANDGVYGLSAGVIAGTLEEAEAIGRRLDAGGISLNDGSLTAMCHEAEKNSFKLSGLGGSRMGPAGYLRFFRRKSLIRQHGTPATIDSVKESLARS